jgi:hypothetical protein
MLDWDAPTGGYLLTACFATGRAAGQGVAQFLALSKKLTQCTCYKVLDIKHLA